MLLSRLLFCQSFLAILFIVATSGSLKAEEQFSTLVTKVPAGANAVIAIDANGLRSSPLGKQKDWAAKNEAAYVNTPFILPPEADKLVVASQLNPNKQLERVWSVAVMSLDEPVSMRAIARAENGTLDDVAGIKAVESPGDVYYLELSDDLLGMMSPANRQLVATWASVFQSRQNQSPYLIESIEELAGGPQIVLALDLKNAVNPQRIRQKLAEAEVVKASKADVDQWASLLETLQGARLSITVTDKIEGSLAVSFGGDPSFLGKHAKEAIIAAISEHGVGFDSIEEWTQSQSQNEIRLQGSLSESDMRRVMSLLETPNPHFSPSTSPEPAQQSSEDAVAEASQQYFSSVSTLLEDMEKEFRTNRDVRRNFPATYMQRYAKRIDDLPILNVDDQLIDYGLRIAETLRSTSVIQGEQNLNSGVRKSAVYKSNNIYDYNNTYRSVSSMKTQIAREEQAVASKARFSNWKEIQDATASIRVAMTKKYGVEF